MPPKKELKTLDSAKSYTVGWITALPPEKAAALVVLDERHSKPKDFVQSESDNNIYSWGRIATLNVVITMLASGEYGIGSAATTANGMRASLPHIRIGLFVGIGAGITQNCDLLLGDVVVSAPDGTNGGVIQYDMYKASQQSGSHGRERKGFLDSPPRVLLNALNALRAGHEEEEPEMEQILELFARNERMRVPYGFPGADKDRMRDGVAQVRESPIIHYGTIASGNTLIKDATQRNELVNWLLTDNIKALCFEMEAAGLMNTFPCLVIRGICDYADEYKDDTWQRYAAATAAAVAKELLGYIDEKQVEQTAYLGEVLKEVKQELSNLRSQVVIAREQSSLQTKLATAKGAGYDSCTNEHVSTCLDGTRTELLRRILDWSTDPTGKCIYWLCGKAGMGKSTIARTIAQRLHNTGHLGATFFFKRGEGDCGSAGRFFPTILSQLADRIPELVPAVVRSLDNDSTLCEHSLQRQFGDLILLPLKNVTPEQNLDLTIVIDALDECAGDGDLRTILRLLPQVNNIPSVRLRLFITSRPDFHIRLGFGRIDGSLHKDVLLEKVQAPTVEHDIRLYFRHRFAEIRREGTECSYNPLSPDWPGDECIDKLVALAVPLFIVASTICRFVSLDDPRGRLERLLQSRNPFLSSINNMYHTILLQLFRGRDAPEHRKILADFRQVVGSIVLLAEPLAIRSLVGLLEVQDETIWSTLQPLHSVLDIDKLKPIRLLHLSFRDFLVEQTDQPAGQSAGPPAGQFHIDETKMHADLFDACIRRLQQPNALRQDICGIQKPGTKRVDVGKDRIEKCIPSDVAYACSHWIWHALEGHQVLRDDDHVHEFLRRHFLHWLEVLNWLGRLSSVIKQINKLRALVDASHGKTLLGFLDDANRFVLKNRYVLDLAPMQLYHSALIFAPLNSVVRRTFEKDVLRHLKVLSQVPLSWSAELLRLEGHGNVVYAVDFSPEGDKIASGSGDFTARVWEASTGEELFQLRHEDSVKSVAFSPDGKHLATASNDQTVRVWDVATGEQLLGISHGETVRSVAYSIEGVIASASRHSVRIWNASTGELLQTLDGRTNSVQAVAFSRDGVSLASQSKDKVLIWDSRSGVERHTFLATSKYWIACVAFSPDDTLLAGIVEKDARIWNLSTGKVQQVLQGERNFTTLAWVNASLATASTDFKLQLWDLSRGECVRVFEGHSPLVNSIAFSPHRQTLASASIYRTVRIWDIATDAQHEYVRGHAGPVTAIDYSKDGTSFASGLSDGTIRIWDVSTGEDILKLDYNGHHIVASLALSPSGDDVVSGHHDEIAIIWDLNTGLPKYPLRGHSGSVDAVAYSPDGSRVATGSSDGTVCIWNSSTGQLERKLELEGLSNGRSETAALAFSTTGALLAIVSRVTYHVPFKWTSIVSIWDTSTFEVKFWIDLEDVFIGSKIEFSRDDRFLFTNKGDFEIDESGIRRCNTRQERADEPVLRLNDEWITHGGEDILWLPIEYRESNLYDPFATSASASFGNTLAIGHESGGVSFFSISHQKQS